MIIERIKTFFTRVLLYNVSSPAFSLRAYHPFFFFSKDDSFEKGNQVVITGHPHMINAKAMTQG